MKLCLCNVLKAALVVFCLSYDARTEGRNQQSQQVPFIVNGWEHVRGRWPWQVAIMLGITEQRQACGAVLISPKYILSAAHCTKYDKAFYQVWVGGHDISDLDQGQLISIERIFNHPNYNGSSKSFPNDISVSELSRPVTLNDYAQLARLPQPGDDFQNNECFISGWGKTDGRVDEKPDVPHEVNMTVLSHNACVSAMADEKDKEIYDTHICVIHETKNASACQGDSGGPLQCRRSPNDPWVVAGITSWGKGDENITCHQSHPSVYTRISSYIDWINNIYNNNTNGTVNTPVNNTGSNSMIATGIMAINGRGTAHGNVFRVMIFVLIIYLLGKH